MGRARWGTGEEMATQARGGVVVGGRAATTSYEAWEVAMQIWHEGDDATAS